MEPIRPFVTTAPTEIAQKLLDEVRQAEQTRPPKTWAILFQVGEGSGPFSGTTMFHGAIINKREFEEFNALLKKWRERPAKKTAKKRSNA